jgi:ABC-type nitrate/sulfonate/bicarbonate transport system permease component
MTLVYRLRYAILALTVVLFVLIWYAYAGYINNRNALASPADTLGWFYQLAFNPGVHNLLVGGLTETMLAIFEGFAIAAVIGVPVGFIMGRYLFVDYFLDPWVNAWYSIPAVAFVPMTMNWFGQSYTATMLVAFLIAVFSIIINVYSGVKNISRSLVEPALSFGANQSQMMAKVILPASLPNIMVGLRLGISRAIDGVVIAEMIFTVGGFGGIIFDAADKLELGLAVACIIILAIISIILNETMKYITKRVISWKESAAMSR